MAHVFELKPFNPQDAAKLRVEARLDHSGSVLTAEFEVFDPEAQVDWPAPLAKAGRGHDLWKQTCLEIFMRDPASGLYWEWNFAPSGEWDAFCFSGYRQRLLHAARASQGVRLIEPVRAGLLRACIDVSFSPLLHQAFLSGDQWQIAPTAVIKTKTHHLSYWAAKHAGAKPDFHAPEGFSAGILPKRCAP